VQLTRFHPKTALLPDIFVMLKILSSEYQVYACGKIFRMVRAQEKPLILGWKLTKNNQEGEVK